MKEAFRQLNKLRQIVTRKDKFRYAFLLLLTVIGSFLEGLSVGVIPIIISLMADPQQLGKFGVPQSLIDQLPEEITFKYFLIATIILICFFTVKSLYMIFVSYYQAWLVEDQRLKLARRMFRCYLTAPYEWFLARNSAELVRNIVMDTKRIASSVMMPLMNLTMGIGSAIMVTAIIIATSPKETLWVLGFVAIGSIVFIQSVQTKLSKMGIMIRNESKRSLHIVNEGLASVVDARVTKSESFLENLLTDSLAKQAISRRWATAIQNISSHYVELMGIVAVFSVLLILFAKGQTLVEILPTLTLMLVGFVRLRTSIVVITNSLNKIVHASPSLPGITKDLDEVSEILVERKSHEEKGSVSSLDELKLSDVCYRYPETDDDAVTGIKLSLKKGESVALVGPTGCGKSTLVNVIIGLLNPRAGDVNVNGVSISKDIDSWHRQIAYIQQSTFLLDDTVRSNIAFGVDQVNVDDADVLKALESAQMSEFIAELPDGLDTVIGERGVRFSGGQRQRLGIARALYRDPDLLIMDESTSALDKDTEDKVMEAVLDPKRNRTLLIITHRLDTVKSCDRLYVLANGNVIDSGSYDELLGSSELFRSLVNDRTV